MGKVCVSLWGANQDGRTDTGGSGYLYKKVTVYRDKRVEIEWNYRYGEE